MRFLFILSIICLLFFSKVNAEEASDNSSDVVEKQNEATIQTFSEVIQKWDANKSSMSVADFLSQKPEKIKTSFFGFFEGEAEIKPFRPYFGISAVSLSGNFDKDLTSKETGLPFTISQPKQQGTGFALNFGRLLGKNRSDDMLIYSGSSEGSNSDNNSNLIASETSAKVLGIEVGESYNFNNQGVHRGIVIGGGLGFQRITITNKTSVLNTPIIERSMRVEVAYLSAKLGYGYLFENKLYLTTFLKGGLPFYSSYEGSDNEEHESSGHLFLNPIFQVSLQWIF